MSQFLHHDNDNDDVKAIAIHQTSLKTDELKVCKLISLSLVKIT